MRRVILVGLIFLAACARLDPLTPESLQAAEQKWRASRPPFYHLVVEIKGDRVEAGRFEIMVRGDAVSIRRNAEVVIPARPQDYSMDGWFRMLRQELDLTDNAQFLGAPPGYASYPMARFEPNSGRLQRFQRTVGGTQNSIDINIVEFQVDGQFSNP